MEKLHNAKEAAELLSVKEPTIRSWISQCRLPVTRLGRLVRIRDSVIKRISERGLHSVEEDIGAIE